MPVFENKPTTEIAFKFKTSKIDYLLRAEMVQLKNHLLEVSPDDAPSDSLKLHLLGLQFHFKEKVIVNGEEEMKYTDNIKLSQLYFNSENKKFYSFNPKVDGLSQLQTYLNEHWVQHHQPNGNQIGLQLNGNLEIQAIEIQSPNLTELEFDNLFRIDEVQDTTIPDSPVTVKFELGETAKVFLGEGEGGKYRQLSLMKEESENAEEYSQVGLVFFPLTDMKFLCKNFNELILSGCRVNLGRKLNHFSEDDLKLYEKSYFTLKIEGHNPKDDVYSNNTSKVTTAVASSAAQEGPVVTLGYGCPPDWHAFSQIAPGLQKITKLPMSQLFVIQKQWNEYSAKMTSNVIIGDSN